MFPSSRGQWLTRMASEMSGKWAWGGSSSQDGGGEKGSAHRSLAEWLGELY